MLIHLKLHVSHYFIYVIHDDSHVPQNHFLLNILHLEALRAKQKTLGPADFDFKSLTTSNICPGRVVWS